MPDDIEINSNIGCIETLIKMEDRYNSIGLIVIQDVLKPQPIQAHVGAVGLIVIQDVLKRARKQSVPYYFGINSNIGCIETDKEVL